MSKTDNNKLKQYTDTHECNNIYKIIFNNIDMHYNEQEIWDQKFTITKVINCARKLRQSLFTLKLSLHRYLTSSYSRI